MSPRVVLLLLISALTVLARPANTSAGELRQLADQPLAILFAKDLNEQNAGQYMQRMTQRMGIGKRTSKQISQQLEKSVVTKSKDPVIGQLFYLVQGLVPSMEMISFQSVVDEDEAKTLIESQQNRLGGEATLEEEGNGFYRIVRLQEQETELQPDQEVQEYNNEGSGYSSKLEVIERDGKRFQKYSWKYTQQFRYHDQFLYSNRAEDFSEVRLPTAREIYDSLEGNNDFGVKIYADRVPVGLKTLGWSLLSAMLGTQLQQQDSEAEEPWRLRQAAGNWGLSLLKSLMFDLDYGEGEGHLAAGRDPIRGRFNLRPRRNSGLIKQLDELGSGRSRFAPLLRDDAALSAHFCLALPSDGQDTVTALARWIEVNAGSSGLSSPAEAGYRSLAQALDDVADAGTFEVLLRLVHSDASGSVILAGIQLRDQADQLQHMEAVVQHICELASEGQVEATQRHGRPLIHVKISPDENSPVRVSDVWIAQRDGCLWLAAGGEHAHEMIRVAADRCGSGGRAVRARLLTTKIDLAHWMTWPKDDPTGLAGIPEWMDTGDGSALIAIVTAFSVTEGLTPTPLLKKVMASRGDKEGWLTLDLGKSGITAEMELGAPLADWFLARQIDAQEKMMEQQEQRQKEAAEQAIREQAAAAE